MMSFKVDKTGVVTVLLLALIICSVTATIDENSKFDEAKAKAGNQAFDAGKEAKDSSESWAGWAKDKITEGLGFRTEDATIDSAKSVKDKITGTAAEKAGELKDKAYQTADMVYDKSQGAKEGMKDKAQTGKDVAGSVKDEAYDKSKDAAGSAYEKARSAKEEAGSMAKEKAWQAAESGEEGLEWAKEKVKHGYEATKHKADEGLESAKQALGNKYEEVAEPHRQKAKDFKEDVILGGRTHDEEL